MATHLLRHEAPASFGFRGEKLVLLCIYGFRCTLLGIDRVQLAYLNSLIQCAEKMNVLVYLTVCPVRRKTRDIRSCVKVVYLTVHIEHAVKHFTVSV